jgi:hypothetical protein
MTQTETATVRLKVSPEVARIVKPGAPRDVQLSAARGALPLAGKDLLTVLFFLCAGKDAEIKKAAVATLKELPSSILATILQDKSLHVKLLNLVTQVRLADGELMGLVITHPETDQKTLMFLAQKGSKDILERLAGHQNMLMESPDVVAAIIANPNAEKALKFRLGWKDPEADKQEEPEEVPEENGDEVDDEGCSQEELDSMMEEADEEGLSKYQIALELKVSEKIKMALTGDKEWRAILTKDSNKLVKGAVMKNPRITDGEVIMIAKNKTTSDELIRMILLNKDWMKLYEMKKALIVHPKTPPPKAMRMVPFLTMKDLKELAKSRQVSTMVATAARKELELRIKKQGG